MTSPVLALAGARACIARLSQRRPASPAELGKRIVRGYRITPAVQLISDALLGAITTPDARLCITLPPRESKSTTVAIVGTLFALMRNPNERVILASYADSLAIEHSRVARALVAEHSQLLGFGLSADKTSAGRWTVDGHDGGLLAIGIMSGVLGFGAGLLILDDVTKNAAEADSEAARRRVLQEYRSTLLSRVHPGGSVVCIGTRWSTTDLIGTLLTEEPDRWTHLNIPAISQAGVPDALQRPFGVAMTSAMGRTPAQFDDLRASVGARSWSALFQGLPSPIEGGLVQQSWIDDFRVPAAPQHRVKTVVAVDPSDSGTGDDCGIIGASLGRDGVIALIADVSEPLTAEAWSRRAVELAIVLGASEIAVESFAAATTYLAVVKNALSRMAPQHAIRVTGWPPRASGRGRGDAEARSSGLLQALETGACVVAGHLPSFEAQAVGWQHGTHQPDAVAAAVVAYDTLSHGLGQQWNFVSPIDLEKRRREMERDPARAGRFASRAGQRDMSPIDARLQWRVSGGGYDPLAHLGQVLG